MFAEDISKNTVTFTNAEVIVSEKLHAGMPPKFLAKTIEQVKGECAVYLNGKITMITNYKLEYFRCLREIYMTIIGKWNSSVANVFVEAFKLKLHGKERRIFQKEFKEFLIKVMKLDLSSIEQDGR